MFVNTTRFIGFSFGTFRLGFNKRLKFTQHPVTNSSNITMLEYCKSGQVLRVKFHTGDTYEYDHVPELVFNGFTFTDSVGKYFNAHIKNVYKTIKLS